MANPENHQVAVDVELLVDIGATFTVVPKDVAARLSLAPEATRQLRAADGRLLNRSQGLAYLRIQEWRATVPVILGEEGDIPVLGVTSLEILGLAFDPVRGELRPSEYLYLGLAA